jgi:HSP20 family protein
MSGHRRPPVSLARHLSERGRAGEPAASAGPSLEGIFGGLKDLAEALGRAAETAQRRDGDAAPRIVFGYTLRTLDGAIQPFGHVPRPRDGAKAAGPPMMPEARTPIIDLFEEAEAIIVVAEVPGLDPAALSLAVEAGALMIEGGGAQRYGHHVPLPCAVDAAAMTHACRNGILEVRLPRAAGRAA